MAKIGQTILVGFTYYNPDRELTEQEQLFGEITGIDQDSLTIKYTNGEEWLIPPYHVVDAPRGEYECVSSGEKVVNPDLLASWIVMDSADPNSPPTWKPNCAPLVLSEVPKEFNHTYDHDRDFIEGLIEAKGKESIGKLVLIGLTYYKQVGDEEEFVEQNQIHGRIVRVSYTEGIVIESGDGTEFKLPSDLSLLQPAPPGEYAERSTGEVVVDPDLITTWSVVSPDKDEVIPK